MASATSSAVFAIIAKDAASAVMGKIGKSMGRLRSAAGMAFRTMVAGAAAAAAAIGALAIASIKSAVEDEKAQVRLVATLRARGLATEKNLALVEQAIKAGQRLGQSDDEVRAGIQTATQYTDKFSKAMKILAVAQDLAIAKDISLEQATSMVGKAFIGKGRALSSLGVQLEKNKTTTEQVVKTQKNGWKELVTTSKVTKETLKGQAALNAITKEYGGIAEEVAQTTAVKFQAAQDRLNEALEDMGARLLPAVNGALDFLVANVLPVAEEAFANLGDAIAGTIDDMTAEGGLVDSVSKVVGSIVDDFRPELEAAATALVGPDGLFTAVGKLIAALWGDGDGALAGAFKLLGKAIEAAFALAKPFFDALTWLVNNITAVVDALNKVSGAEFQAANRQAQGAAAGSTVFGLGTGVGAGGGGMGGSGYASGYAVTPVSLTIGTKAQSQLGYAYGNAARTSTAIRNTGRGR